MERFWDSLTGTLLVVIAAAYLSQVQAQSAPKEAVLAEISNILTDLESGLHQAEGPDGNLPMGLPLTKTLAALPGTALIGHPGDAPLMPDFTEDAHGVRLGGCAAESASWSLLRIDGAALTGIPDTWRTPRIVLCLDRNGSAGPNRDGYDVIRLAVSRVGSPHITLIPMGEESGRVTRS